MAEVFVEVNQAILSKFYKNINCIFCHEIHTNIINLYKVFLYILVEIICKPWFKPHKFSLKLYVLDLYAVGAKSAGNTYSQKVWVYQIDFA